MAAVKRLSVTSVVATLLLTVWSAPPAEAAPPKDAACLPLALGATGLPLVGGAVPPMTSGIGAVSKVSLPRQVWTKNGALTFASDRAFAVVDHQLFSAKANRGVLGSGEKWHSVNLPACLDGKIQSVAADGHTLVVIGAGRQVYTNDLAGGGVPTERWTWRWGPLLWLGDGWTLPSDVKSHAYSDFSSSETFTDSAGRVHNPIGVGSHYLLKSEGTRIVLEDPWLPTDQSRAVCLPQNGRARLANLDASGSTILVVTRSGRIYTRIYDFDVTGANSIFGSYTWESGLPAEDERWQLPVAGWRAQPTPPGVITDAVAIVRTGNDANQRELRVAGRWKARNGVWTKSLTAKDWTFHPHSSLPGRRLPLATTTFDPATVKFVGSIAGKRAEISGFDWACTPSTLAIRISSSTTVPAQLWAYDGLRQAKRDSGITDVPREYNAAVVIPSNVWRDLPTSARTWVTTSLGGRVAPTTLSVTATRMTFHDQCWTLTKDGKPARPDTLGSPPDLVVPIARLLREKNLTALLPSC